MHQGGHGTGLTGHFGHPGGVGEHRDGTSCDRVAGESGAVRGGAGQRGEQVTRQHVLGAQGHAGHRQVRNGYTALRAVGQDRADLGGQAG